MIDSCVTQRSVLQGSAHKGVSGSHIAPAVSVSRIVSEVAEVLECGWVVPSDGNYLQTEVSVVGAKPDTL